MIVGGTGVLFRNSSGPSPQRSPQDDGDTHATYSGNSRRNGQKENEAYRKIEKTVVDLLEKEEHVAFDNLGAIHK